jgi:hypothetical protein
MGLEFGEGTSCLKRMKEELGIDAESYIYNGLFPNVCIPTG